MNNRLIHAQNVRVRYGSTLAVDNVSVDIYQGDIVAIVGPNGSGKTTFLKALLGIVPFDGLMERSYPVRAVGYVPQYLTFDRTLPITTEEFIRLQQLSTITQTEIDHELEHVGALELKGKLLGVLSGGQLQRVLIAAALIGNPSILFFDEPSSGIDIGGEQTVYTLMYELATKHHLTVLFISHDLDIVFDYATSVICLNKTMVCHGKPHQVLTGERLNELYGRHAATYGHHH